MPALEQIRALLFLSKKAVVETTASMTFKHSLPLNRFFSCILFAFCIYSLVASRFVLFSFPTKSAQCALYARSDLYSMSPILKEWGASQAYDLVRLRTNKPWESVRNILCIVFRCRTLKQCRANIQSIEPT